MWLVEGEAKPEHARPLAPAGDDLFAVWALQIEMSEDAELVAMLAHSFDSEDVDGCSASQAAISSPRSAPRVPVGVVSSTQPVNPCDSKRSCSSAAVLPYRQVDEMTTSAPPRATISFST